MTDEEKGNEMEDNELTSEQLAEAVGRVNSAETVDEFFAALDAIEMIDADGWDTAEINEVVQLILTDRDERPDSILRAREAAAIIEMRVRAFYNVNEPLLVPPEWEHRVPA